MNASLLSFNQHDPRMVVNRERRDSRVMFNDNRQVIAEVGTMLGYYKLPIRDLSTSGAFVSTELPLNVGEEITLDFMLPCHGKPIKITGEIIRKSKSGVGVEFRIIFKY